MCKKTKKKTWLIPWSRDDTNHHTVYHKPDFMTLYRYLRVIPMPIIWYGLVRLTQRKKHQHEESVFGKWWLWKHSSRSRDVNIKRPGADNVTAFLWKSCDFTGEDFRTNNKEGREVMAHYEQPYTTYQYLAFMESSQADSSDSTSHNHFPTFWRFKEVKTSTNQFPCTLSHQPLLLQFHLKQNVSLVDASVHWRISLHKGVNLSWS